MSEDIAVAHWAQSINGGGERVAWELARAFDTELYVGEASADCAPADVDVVDLFEGTWYGRALRRGGVAQLVASQLAWECPDALRDADTLVTSGNEPLAYVPDPEQPWVHYVHHTSRRATDRLPVVRDGSLGGLAESLARKTERQLYSRYAQKPTLLVANSEAIARRIRQYWGVDRDRIRVVYPPVPTADYGRDHATTQDYYLALQRLDDHKRLGEVIDAFRELDVPLKIAGDGSEREALEQQAAGAENIELLGYVDEARKRELLAGANAKVINAHREDFGLTTVEALASGTPIVGVRDGFTQHLVIDGETGISYERGVDNLRAAVRSMEELAPTFDAASLERFARQFNAGRFREEMHEAVNLARLEHQIKPDFGVTPPTDQPDAAVADGGDHATQH